MEISTIQVLFFVAFLHVTSFGFSSMTAKASDEETSHSFNPLIPSKKDHKHFPFLERWWGTWCHCYIDVLFWNKKKMASEFRFPFL